ncbi:hypothetical protein FACS189456_2760 [Bacteroidia bacterium]|nr:hypothetical protein FACS189456_2760 [Bacteroidia bacterium]
MKHILTIILALTLGIAAFAQQEFRHEVSIYGNGGLSTLHYNLLNGSRSNGFGGGGGLDYTFNISPRWAVNVGAGVALYNALVAIGNNAVIITPNLQDPSGEPMELHTTFDGYQERQQATYLNIPIMLRFSRGRFFAQAGAKVGVPLAARYSLGDFTVTNRAWYTHLGNYAPEQAAQGIGTFGNQTGSGDLTLSTSVSAALEAGLRWQLNARLRLYTSLYVDYGLTDIAPARTDNQMQWNLSDDFDFHSVLTSHNETGSSLADKVVPLAVGIKVALSFGFSTTRRSQPAGTAPEPAPAPEQEAAPAPAPESAPAPATAPEPVPAPEPDPAMLEAEHQRKAADEQRLAGERLLAEEQRLTEEKRAKEQGLAAERLLAEQKSATEQRLAIAKEKIQQQQSEDSYSPNSTELSAQQKADMDEKADLLLQFYPDKNIIIEGHTCNLGTHAVNLLIAQTRADNAKAYLVQKGIAANRITIVSKAETEPLVPNTSEANRKKNRRVVVLVVD